MDIKILVATHKKYLMPNDDIYLPIQVGAEGKEDFGYIKDNTGDNISIKNPNYCELTALYWAWKNLNCDYIGLCHYRRYFSHNIKGRFFRGRKASILSKSDIKHILLNYDIILPPLITCKESVKDGYYNNHYKKDLDIIEKIITTKYPNYLEDYYHIMNNNYLHFLNMFIMSIDKFHSYCSWLFPILFESEKYINTSSYNSYQSRVYGFLSERLFNIWLHHNNFKIYETNIVSIHQNQKFLRKKIEQLQEYLNYKFFNN